MESDEQANPVDVDVFGSRAVVQISDALADLVKQLHRDERRQHEGELGSDTDRCDPPIQRGRSSCEHELLRRRKTTPYRPEIDVKTLCAGAPLLPGDLYCINIQLERQEPSIQAPYTRVQPRRLCRHSHKLWRQSRLPKTKLGLT